jgi:hypothetical protein
VNSWNDSSDPLIVPPLQRHRPQPRPNEFGDATASLRVVDRVDRHVVVRRGIEFRRGVDEFLQLRKRGLAARPSQKPCDDDVVCCPVRLRSIAAKPASDAVQRLAEQPLDRYGLRVAVTLPEKHATRSALEGLNVEVVDIVDFTEDELAEFLRRHGKRARDIRDDMLVQMQRPLRAELYVRVTSGEWRQTNEYMFYEAYWESLLTPTNRSRIAALVSEMRRRGSIGRPSRIGDMRGERFDVRKVVRYDALRDCPIQEPFVPKQNLVGFASKPANGFESLDIGL